jgi:hypothetical protein
LQSIAKRFSELLLFLLSTKVSLKGLTIQQTKIDQFGRIDGFGKCIMMKRMDLNHYTVPIIPN